MAAEKGVAANQLAAAVLIHHGDEAVSKLHFDGVHRQEAVDIVDILIEIGCAGLRRLLHRDCRRCHSLRLLAGHLAADIPAANRQANAYDQQGDVGRTGDQAQQGNNYTSREDGPGLAAELVDHVVIEAAVGDGTGDHHGGGRGDHEGGDLGDQAVTDGGNGVDVPHVLHAGKAAHNQSAHQVDGGNNQ